MPSALRCAAARSPRKFGSPDSLSLRLGRSRWPKGWRLFTIRYRKPPFRSPPPQAVPLSLSNARYRTFKRHERATRVGKLKTRRERPDLGQCVVVETTYTHQQGASQLTTTAFRQLFGWHTYAWERASSGQFGSGRRHRLFSTSGKIAQGTTIANLSRQRRNRFGFDPSTEINQVVTCRTPKMGHDTAVPSYRRSRA